MDARRVIKVSLVLLLLVVFVICYQQLSLRPQLQVAPDFTLPSLSPAAKPITLQQYRGRAVVLNFFATWCHNCRREKKHLQALQQALPVIAILTFDATPDLNILPLHTVARDPDGAVARRYGVNWLPQTFLINAAGHVVQHFTQPLNTSRYQTLRAHIVALGKRSVR